MYLLLKQLFEKLIKGFLKNSDDLKNIIWTSLNDLDLTYLIQNG